MHLVTPRLAALLILLLPSAMPAMARQVHPEAVALCRAECVQTGSSQLGVNRPRVAQACAIRCAASMSFLRQQNRSGSAAATGRGQGPTLALDASPAQPRPVARGAARRGSAHQRRPRPVISPTRQARRAAPVPAMQAAGPPGGLHGVIYAARTPSAGFGMVVGEHDRLAAYRGAERSCAASGPDCRLLAEFTASCGAAAHGVLRSQWAMFMTSDPNSYVVTSLSAGSGGSQAVAEREALAECHSRDPRATCRISASACAGQG